MRVLGIDPGLTRCGMGVVDGSVGRPLSLVDVNVLRTSSDLHGRPRCRATPVASSSAWSNPRRRRRITEVGAHVTTSTGRSTIAAIAPHSSSTASWWRRNLSAATTSRVGPS